MTALIVLLIVLAVGGLVVALTRKKPAALEEGHDTPDAALPPKPAAPKTLPAKATEPAAKATGPSKTVEAVEHTAPVAEPAIAEVAEPAAPALVVTPPPVPAAPTSRSPLSKKDMTGLKRGLSTARKGFLGRIKDLLGGRKEIDPSLLADIEEVLLTSDVGPETTASLVERLKERLERNELADSDAVWKALREEATRILSLPSAPLTTDAHKPTVVLFVGVNGAGKTTTIGKLATHFVGKNKRVLLGAGDTFRAAAVAQLEAWGKRVGAEVVKGKDGADPGAVAFEATSRAKSDGADILFVDTAGRLHTKTPLMDEIKKVRRTIAKAEGSAPHETFLVLDATTGQNAIAQAKLFKEAVDLTGIVLTKLDGTAKGGVVLAICDQIGVPVRYVGLGERAEDLREFHAPDFVEALFSPSEDDA